MKNANWLVCGLAVWMFAAAVLPAADAPAAAEQRIKDLITQLGDKDFKKREAASAELKAIGKPAVAQLTAAQKHEDPEVSTRASELLDAINPPAAASNEAPAAARVARLGGRGGMLVMRVQGNAGQAQGNAVQVQMGVVGAPVEAPAMLEFGTRLEQQDKGVRVTEVKADTDAAKLGLQKDDVILKLNDKAMCSPDDIAATLKGLKATDALTMEIQRADKTQTLKRPAK